MNIIHVTARTIGNLFGSEKRPVVAVPATEVLVAQARGFISWDGEKWDSPLHVAYLLSEIPGSFVPNTLHRW